MEKPFSTKHPVTSKFSPPSPPLKQRRWSYLKLFIGLAFFLAISNAITAYVHSSYLAQFVGEKYVGLIYTLAHFLVFITILKYTSIINWLKIFKASMLAFVVMAACLFGLGITGNPITAIFFFLIYIVFLNLIWISLDIYIEYFSQNELTGRIRGIHLTGLHIAWFLSPITAGFVLKNSTYPTLYLIGAVLVVLVMLGFYFKFRKLEINHFPKPHFFRAIKKIYKNHQLNGIFVIAFLLQSFYCAFVVYAPIYLTKYIGFQWHEIGIMFTIMLSTFVFFTYPAGWLADKYIGEKELLTIGLFIMGIAAIIFGLTSSTSFWVWLIILVCTRIGASFIEIMRDTYFFKHVDVQDIHIINLFRNTGPLAYIVTPLLATGILHFFGFQYIFVVVGILVLGGLWFSVRMKDTL